MDRIGLYCILILVFVIFSPVELKDCPRLHHPVRVSVRVSYRESSVQEDYSHHKEVQSHSSFKERYDSLDVSASASGSYGGFSASASAAYNDVASSKDSSSSHQELEKTRWTKFKPGFLQVVRVITREVSIAGIASKTITTDYVDSVRIENDLSTNELRKREDDYLKRNFGHSKKGKIQGSTYTEESCMKFRLQCWESTKFNDKVHSQSKRYCDDGICVSISNAEFAMSVASCIPYSKSDRKWKLGVNCQSNQGGIFSRTVGTTTTCTCSTNLCNKI
jgi:hypothetical protein